MSKLVIKYSLQLSMHSCAARKRENSTMNLADRTYRLGAQSYQQGRTGRKRQRREVRLRSELPLGIGGLPWLEQLRRGTQRLQEQWG